MDIRGIIFALARLGFSVVIGGAIYEHIAVVPQWSMAAPASLAMFQGEYGLRPGPFWMMIHPVTLVFMGLSLLLFWKTSFRQGLLITLSGYILVLVITFIYFVPELLSITGSAYSVDVDPILTSRSRLWETLSLVRLAFLIVLAVILLKPRELTLKKAT
ncbi:hypothetical protein GCM10027036_26500 [Flavihumibacter cheonanensis]|uniref:hypothetical protein n=1 Tax=Flavihumibacter cheonanensis TaxID=1442385 RepID=UPI001EF972BB|nr:hypothetical protein [Flavihumibacter cheonanensis]MCG7753327.1 hypothetical protein [Flavihumibacter cheonanensis]